MYLLKKSQLKNAHLIVLATKRFTILSSIANSLRIRGKSSLRHALTRLIFNSAVQSK